MSFYKLSHKNQPFIITFLSDLPFDFPIVRPTITVSATNIVRVERLISSGQGAHVSVTTGLTQRESPPVAAAGEQAVALQQQAAPATAEEEDCEARLEKIRELFGSLELPRLSPSEESLLPVPAPDRPTPAPAAAAQVSQGGSKLLAGSSIQPGPARMAPGKGIHRPGMGAKQSMTEKERLATRRAWERVNTDPAFKRIKPPTMWGKTKHYKNHCSKCGAAGHRYNDCYAAVLLCCSTQHPLCTHSV